MAPDTAGAGRSGTASGQSVLLASAQDWLRRALDAYVEEDQRVVLTNAGVALEQFCKAYLAKQNPALLADLKGDFDSLLSLVGLGHHVVSGRRAKTVGGFEALKRTRQLLPAIRSVPLEALTEVMEERNGLLHAGQVSHGNATRLFTAVLSALDLLMNALGVPSTARWGQYGALVARMLEERAEETAVEVARKIAAANSRYDAFVTSLPVGPVREQVLVAAERTISLSKSELQEITCPACHRKAWALGYIEVNWQASVADGLDRLGFQTFFAEEFLCPVCELSLSTDELAAAEIPESWVLEDLADPVDHLLPGEHDAEGL